MILIQLNGGLGNQMFQYAIGRCLAHSLNTELKLDTSQFQPDNLRNYALSVFRIVENFATPIDLTRVRRPLAWSIKYPVDLLRSMIQPNAPILYIKESKFHFDPEILALPDNLYLEGYWQSEKYFKVIEKIIRNDFTFSVEPDYLNKQMADQIRICESVSIHVRRGDFVTNPTTNAYHGTCSVDYYKKAIQIIKNRVHQPQFFIFTDDPIWVREHLDTGYPTVFVDFNGPEKDYEDLRLMSLCQHHIIANSSFSWWGAWLCQNTEKIVIAPIKWFNKPDINTQDLIPDTWIRL